jgi:uridine phosphorylase
MTRSSETVSGPDRRQYHIELKPGDVAEYILLCGDVQRAEKVSRFFDSLQVQRQHREFVTFTGAYRGIPLSAVATGIGPDNTDIALTELLAITERPTIIRIGSCGALQPHIDLGDLIISHEALRYENTSLEYVPRSVRALSDPVVESALVRSCAEQGLRYVTGTTCTASGFYASQGRKPADVPCIRDPRLAERLSQEGVSNFEMEMSVLFARAGISEKHARAGGVCVAYANRIKDVFADTEIPDIERRVILAGLGAVARLHADDQHMKVYTVLKDGRRVHSGFPGRYAGHAPRKVFGTLDCRSGMRMKPGNRVFFHHLRDALEQGYRPCKNCRPISAADAKKYLKSVRHADSPPLGPAW